MISIPDNAQLQVYYTQISVLTHWCVTRASWRCAHIFSDRDDRQRVRKQSKVQKAKPHLPKQILTRDADWSKSLFPEFYSNADWLKVQFLPPTVLTGLLSLAAKSDTRKKKNHHVANDKLISSSIGEILGILQHATPVPDSAQLDWTGILQVCRPLSTCHASFSFVALFVGFHVMHNMSTVRWIISPTIIQNSHVSTMHAINTALLSFVVGCGCHSNDCAELPPE